MPTVLIQWLYRFYFYSHEPNELQHIHVDRDLASAKLWLNPVGLSRSLGFSGRQLRIDRANVEENREEFLEK